jgi:rhodanese-related sulfurtransferase
MKEVLLQSVVIVALSVVGGVATKIWHPYAPVAKVSAGTLGEGEISVADALRWSGEDKVVWIDARSRAEFEKAHAPGAFLLNEAEWNELLWDSGPELMEMSDKRYVVYCGNMDCHASIKIAEKLRERGFYEVLVLKGGWPALEAALKSP